MVDKYRLLERIHSKGYNMKSLAAAVDIPMSSFRYKLTHDTFGTDDIKKIMAVLDIKDPVPYFFN